MGFNFANIKECLVLDSGFCLTEGHEVNIIFLHVRNDGFGFLWVVSLSSNVRCAILCKAAVGYCF